VNLSPNHRANKLKEAFIMPIKDLLDISGNARKKAKAKAAKRVAIEVGAVTAAAAAGVVAGILLAPKSGKETREDIRKKAGEVTETIKKKVSSLKGSAGQDAAGGEECPEEPQKDK
jgi:hypothetical protein